MTDKPPFTDFAADVRAAKISIDNHRTTDTLDYLVEAATTATLAGAFHVATIPLSVLRAYNEMNSDNDPDAFKFLVKGVHAMYDALPAEHKPELAH